MYIIQLFFIWYNMYEMKRKRTSKKDASMNWLPIDNRLILPLFSFGHVHGAAKVFLMVEMILAFGVVLGTFFMLVLHYII